MMVVGSKGSPFGPNLCIKCTFLHIWCLLCWPLFKSHFFLLPVIAFEEVPKEGPCASLLCPFFTVVGVLQTKRHHRYLSRTRTRISYILARGPQILCQLTCTASSTCLVPWAFGIIFRRPSWLHARTSCLVLRIKVQTIFLLSMRSLHRPRC